MCFIDKGYETCYVKLGQICSKPPKFNKGQMVTMNTSDGTVLTIMSTHIVDNAYVYECVDAAGSTSFIQESWLTLAGIVNGFSVGMYVYADFDVSLKKCMLVEITTQFAKLSYGWGDIIKVAIGRICKNAPKFNINDKCLLKGGTTGHILKTRIRNNEYQYSTYESKFIVRERDIVSIDTPKEFAFDYAIIEQVKESDLKPSFSIGDRVKYATGNNNYTVVGYVPNGEVIVEAWNGTRYSAKPRSLVLLKSKAGGLMNNTIEHIYNEQLKLHAKYENVQGKLLKDIEGLIEESTELKREIPNRKYWKTEIAKLDSDKVHKELADCFIFCLMIAQDLELCLEDLLLIVRSKQLNNLKLQGLEVEL